MSITILKMSIRWRVFKKKLLSWKYSVIIAFKLIINLQRILLKQAGLQSIPQMEMSSCQIVSDQSNLWAGQNQTIVQTFVRWNLFCDPVIKKT